MSDIQTHGFDVVVEVAEREVNEQLALLSAAGDLPTAVDRMVTVGAVRGTLHLIFGTASVDFDTAIENGVRLSLPFTGSSFEITAPVTATLAPLAGRVRITHRVSVLREGNTRQVVLDFTSGVEDVGVELSSATETLLENAGRAAGLTVDSVRATAEQQIAAFLHNDLRRIALTPSLPVDPASDDPFIPKDLDVRVINDRTALDRDAIAFLISTSSGTRGDPRGFTRSQIPRGQRATIVFSNDLVLHRLVCPELAQALQLGEDAFEAPCKLREPRVVEGGVTLTSLEAVVVDNHLRIVGTFEKGGTGYSAHGRFEARVFLDLENGAIEVRLEQEEPEVEVDIDWWVYLLGFLLGGAIFGPVGAVVGAIVVAIVDAVLDVVASRWLNDLISDRLQGVGDLRYPLGPLGAGLSLDGVVLDDLALSGVPLRREIAPHAAGSDIRIEAGRGLDLDARVIAVTPVGGTVRGLDIGWYTREGRLGIGPIGAARLAVLDEPYGQVSLLDLQRTTYEAGAFVLASRVPAGVAGASGLRRIVLGVRTGERRYAKCAAFREADGALRLRYTTYDTPIPAVEVEDGWTIVEERLRMSGLDRYTELMFGFVPEMEVRGITVGGRIAVERESRTAPYEDYDIAQRGLFRARPRLLAYPVRYAWRLGGVVLRGSGTVSVAGRSVAYRVDQDDCELRTGLGHPLDTDLCLTATGQNGVRVSACREIYRAGMYRKGGRPKRRDNEDVLQARLDALAGLR